jgi:phospholipid/cholesterol/gamma-HCH transport system substrate-binding protein
MKRAIRKHIGDFAAIVVLIVLSVIVGGYILGHQGLRFPFIQSAPFTIKAELSTAQAVTPGQGQSVRVSGVEVGLISGVAVKNGLAVVSMQISRRYKHLIHTDATALLRPRTGLKDMFIELNPGSSGAPTVKPGFTIPVANTLPDVNVDEILSSLDADTRAYLTLLINGAGHGLRQQGGSELAQVLERFEPTHRDLARVSRAVAKRGANLRRLVNSLQRLNTALAAKQGQIVQLVDSSARVFRAFASEQGNVSRAVADLPGTLAQTTATLGEVQAFADQLGPAASSLLPAAHALPAANRALTTLAGPEAQSCGPRSTCAIVRSQIRPFVVAARPVVHDLAPAAVKLATATPNLERVFGVLNHLVNMLGYFPSGGQHGYLWWLAWLGHNTRTLFSVQDANGAYRPLFIEFSCPQVALLTGPTSPFGLVGSLLNLAPLRPFCPGLGAAGDAPSGRRTWSARGAVPALSSLVRSPPIKSTD